MFRPRHLRRSLAPLHLRTLAPLVLVALAIVPIALAGQQRDAAPRPAGTGEISGVVWSAGSTPQPVRRAVVSLAGGDLPARSVITDDAGQFVFAKLPAGTYSVTAKKPAYLPTEFGSTKPGRAGAKLPLGVGEKRAIGLTIFKGGAIAGSLRDEMGRPVAGASVSAIDARAARDPNSSVSPETVSSDDRGEYRIFGLMPGDYVIVASATPPGAGEIALRSATEMDAVLASLAQRQNRPVPVASAPTVAGAPAPTPTPMPRPALIGYAPVYFPGTPLYVEGARIHVEAGDERAGVSFVASHVPVASIEGVVSGGVANLATVQLSITPDTPRFNISTGGITSTPPDANGVFKYGNLAPGRYRIVARVRSGPPDPNAPALAGRAQAVGGISGGAPPPGVVLAPTGDMLYAVAEVDVRGQDVTGVSLQLQMGGTLSGKVVFDAAKAPVPDDLTELRCSVSLLGGSWVAQTGNTRVGPALSSIQAVNLNADGTFEIRGVGPALYTVSCQLPSEYGTVWKLRSAIVDGRDLLDTQIQGPSVSLRGATLTLSDKRTQVTGTVRSGSGQPASDCYVVAFSTDRANWRIGSRRNMTARPATDGSYELADLPPGEYFLALVTDPDPLDWQLPESLEPLSQGSVKIRVPEGAKVVQDLKSGPG